MDFFERLAVAKWMLQKQGRISYATLKREFGLNDDSLKDLRHELIIGQRLAADEDGEVLIWIGDGESTAKNTSIVQPEPDRDISLPPAWAHLDPSRAS